MENNPSNVVHVFAWCKDKEILTKRAESEGKTVSHGICPECAKKHF